MSDTLTGFSAGDWTFIDRELQYAVEDIAGNEVERLRAAYRDRQWSHEIIHPDGSREVFGR